jgi:hypothetical protein
MPRYAVTYATMTTGTGTADNSSLTTLQYGAISGSSATMQLKINEVQCGGEEASTSKVQAFALRRDSTVAATSLTSAGMSQILLDGTATATASPFLISNTSTTKPIPLSNGSVLRHSFNAYGGLVRWQARQGEEITTIGQSANFGEISYSTVNATNQASALVSWHILLEQV